MAKRVYSKAQKKSCERYIERNDLVQIGIRVPRAKKKEYEEAAISQGKSLNRYIIDKIEGLP